MKITAEMRENKAKRRLARQERARTEDEEEFEKCHADRSRIYKEDRHKDYINQWERATVRVRERKQENLK